MKDKYLMSIVIATYNSKKHINNLLLSFSKIWDIKRIEFLFIDDGSTDGTPLYLKNKISKYKNSRLIINSENNGIAFIREFGAKNAKGTWIWYVDCDDIIINTHKITELLDILQASNKDAISFKYILNINGVDQIPKIWNRFKTLPKITPYSIDKQNNIPLIDYVVNKIFKASKLREIKWYKTYNEDTQFAGVIHSTFKFDFYNEFLYSYTRREGSISRRKNYSQLVAKSTLKFLEMIIENNPKHKELYIVTSVYIIICRMHRVDNNDLPQLKILFKKYKNHKLMKWYFSYNWKFKLLYWLCVFRGITLARIVLKIKFKIDNRKK